MSALAFVLVLVFLSTIVNSAILSHSTVHQLAALPIPKNLTDQIPKVGSSSSSGVGFGSGAPGSGGGGGYAVGGGAAAGGGGGTRKGGSGGGTGVSSGGRGSGRSCTTGFCGGGVAYGAYDPVKNATKERPGANAFGFGSGSPGKGGGGGIGIGGGAGGGGGGGDKNGGNGGGAAAGAGAMATGDGNTNTTRGFGTVAGVGYKGKTVPVKAPVPKAIPAPLFTKQPIPKKESPKDAGIIPTIVIGGKKDVKVSGAVGAQVTAVPVATTKKKFDFQGAKKTGVAFQNAVASSTKTPKPTPKPSSEPVVAIPIQSVQTAVPVPANTSAQGGKELFIPISQ